MFGVVWEHFVDLFVISSAFTFLCYLFASVGVLSRLLHPQGPNIKLALTLGFIGILSHTANNIHYLFIQDSINFSLPNVVSLVSLLIVITVTITALKYKVNLLLPVIYGFAGCWQLLMIFIPPIAKIPLMADKAYLLVHISLALLAYCVLIIATLYAFQVSYINMKLKHKNLTAVSHLPPLMQVEKQLFCILAFGTSSLFLSIATGLTFLDDFLATANAHKTVLSVAALLCYAVILWGHFKQGWRGHRVLILTVIASVLLTLAYFGSRFVREFLI